MISLNQVRPGTTIIFRSFPYEVVEANHLKMGRGGAKLQTKLRNLVTRAVIDFTFAGDERLEEAQVSYHQAQFLYTDQQQGHFMFTDNFEQVQTHVDAAQLKFLTEGSTVDLMIWNNQPIAVKLPKKLSFQVAYTEPAAKGNTVTAATKVAQLETGAKIQVPLFIKTGDTIEVNTETGLYTARV